MKFVFVGDRFSVLREMFKQNCEIVAIFVIQGSYGEKKLKEENIDYRYIGSKSEFIEALSSLEFDYLISNGCPHVLPVSRLKKENQTFINVHPSLLPDLKGVHPVNGAILNNRKHGVTCHEMDDGIDSGATIARMEIPITEEMDLGLLYQITFEAEGKVFSKALEKSFKADETRHLTEEPIYYTRKPEDLRLSDQDTLEMVLRKIWAFGVPTQCARFSRLGREYKILAATVVHNPVFDTLYDDAASDEIVAQFGTAYLVKEGEYFIKFELLETAEFGVHDRFFYFDLKNYQIS